MTVDVPVVGKVGDYLTFLFPDLAKLEGRISDTSRGSFLLEFDMDDARREKLFNKLAWLERDERSHHSRIKEGGPRIVPANRNRR